MKTVAVVGAGISGLSLAREIARRGVDVRVFEASERVGGKVQSEEIEGFRLECGPTAFSDDGALLQLVKELGLESQLQVASSQAKQRYLGDGVRLLPIPTSPPALLRSRLLPLGAKLRLLSEPMVRRGRNSDGETVAEFFTRRFGRQVGSLAGAFVSGVYAGDATRLSMAAAFPRLSALERDYGSVFWGLRRSRFSPAPLRSFTDGLKSLTDALAQDLGAAIVLRCAVRRIRPEGQHWRITVDDPQGQQECEVDAVVLAQPAYAAAEAVAALDAGLFDVLREIPYASVTVVHLGWDKKDLDLPPGFGFLVAPKACRGVLGSVFVSNLFSGRCPKDRVLVSSMLGGACYATVSNQSDEELVALANAELSLYLGRNIVPRFMRVVHHAKAIAQYNVGHGRRVAIIHAAQKRYPGLFFAGSSYHGVSLADCVRHTKDLADSVFGALQ